MSGDLVRGSPRPGGASRGTASKAQPQSAAPSRVEEASRSPALALVVRGAHYSIPGGRVVAFPDLQVSNGVRCVLRGASGSGKSTLCRALAGRLPSPFAKQMTTQLQANPYFCGSLHADTWQVPAFTYIGPEPIRHQLVFKVSDFFRDGNEGAALLAQVGMHERFLFRDPTTLSTGEATRVLVASAMQHDRPVLLDGVWTWLDAGSRDGIASGLFAAVANQFVVEAEGPVRLADSSLEHLEVDFNEGKERPTSRTLLERLGTFETGSAYGEAVEVSVRMRITQRRYEHLVVGRDIALRRGAVTWVRGPNGTGKTTVGRALALLPLGEEVTAESLRAAAGNGRARVGFVNGAWGSLSPSLARVARRLLGTDRATPPLGPLDALAADVRQLSPQLRTLLHSLNDQIRLGRDLVFLDEPFATLTSSESGDLWAICAQLARISGVAMLVASHLEAPASLRVPVLDFSLDADGSGRRTTITNLAEPGQ